MHGDTRDQSTPVADSHDAAVAESAGRMDSDTRTDAAMPGPREAGAIRTEQTEPARQPGAEENRPAAPRRRTTTRRTAATGAEVTATGAAATAKAAPATRRAPARTAPARPPSPPPANPPPASPPPARRQRATP